MEGPQKLNKTESDMNEARGKLTEAMKKVAEAQRQMEDQLFTDDDQRKQVEREFNAARETAKTLKNTVESLQVQRKIFRAYEYPQNMENKVQARENAILEVQKAKVAARSELQQKQEEATKQKDLIDRHTRRIDDLKQRHRPLRAARPGRRDHHLRRPRQQPHLLRPADQGRLGVVRQQHDDDHPGPSAFEIDFNIAEEYRGRSSKARRRTSRSKASPGCAWPAS
jgi:chromosome segregation ATPase